MQAMQQELMSGYLEYVAGKEEWKIRRTNI